MCQITLKNYVRPKITDRQTCGDESCPDYGFLHHQMEYPVLQTYLREVIT